MADFSRSAFRHDHNFLLRLSLALAEACPAPRAVATEEALPLKDGSLDLVTSVLSLHLVNDLPGALIQIRRTLRPDGLFLAALLGGDTLIELRQAFMMAETETMGGRLARVFPTADVRDMGGLLQRAGFALPVVDSERLTVTYPTPLALIKELKAMGAANPLVARSRKPMRRDTLAQALETYSTHFSGADGKVRATFEILYLCGWAPHESQQKPLKPGSAAARLADALGATEIALGDRAAFPRNNKGIDGQNAAAVALNKKRGQALVCRKCSVRRRRTWASDRSRQSRPTPAPPRRKSSRLVRSPSYFCVTQFHKATSVGLGIQPSSFFEASSAAGFSERTSVGGCRAAFSAAQADNEIEARNAKHMRSIFAPKRAPLRASLATLIEGIMSVMSLLYDPRKARNAAV